MKSIILFGVVYPVPIIQNEIAKICSLPVKKPCTICILFAYIASSTVYEPCCKWKKCMLSKNQEHLTGKEYQTEQH